MPPVKKIGVYDFVSDFTPVKTKIKHFILYTRAAAPVLHFSYITLRKAASGQMLHKTV